MVCVLPGGVGQLKAAAAAAVVYSAWNSTLGTTNIAFSNNDRTATNINNMSPGSTRGTKSLTNGAGYFEITLNLIDTNELQAAGVCDASLADWAGVLTNFTNASSLSPLATAYRFTKQGVRQNLSDFPAPAANDVIGVSVLAVSFASVVGVCFSLNGIWIGTGTTTFPGPTMDVNWNAPVFPIYPACSVGGGVGSSQCTLNVGNAPFAYPIPPSYEPWG